MPIVPETPLEARIASDPDWLAGVAWGAPRPGHPEGCVRAHVEEVLANVDRLALDADDRARLRVVALLHDACKHQVDRSRPRTGENHHATRARRLAERHLDDAELLEVVELHDEAYNAFLTGRHGRGWPAAEARARRLVERLGPSLPFYLRFLRADNATGSKQQEPLAWFEQVARRHHR